MVIFCGSRYFPQDTLPKNIALLRFAILDIQLSLNGMPIRDLLADVVALLASSRIVLESLQLRIMLSPELFIMNPNRVEDEFHEFLDTHLSSLKAFRGGPEVEVQVDGDPELTNLEINAIFLSQRTAVSRRILEYVRALIGDNVIELEV